MSESIIERSQYLTVFVADNIAGREARQFIACHWPEWGGFPVRVTPPPRLIPTVNRLEEKGWQLVLVERVALASRERVVTYKLLTEERVIPFERVETIRGQIYLCVFRRAAQEPPLANLEVTQSPSRRGHVQPI